MGRRSVYAGWIYLTRDVWMSFGRRSGKNTLSAKEVLEGSVSGERIGRGTCLTLTARDQNEARMKPSPARFPSYLTSTRHLPISGARAGVPTPSGRPALDGKEGDPVWGGFDTLKGRLGRYARRCCRRERREMF